MRLDFFKKEKIIKYSILVILAVGLLSIVYKFRSIECHDYVDNLCYECNDINDLDDYIEYNMLSNEIKKCITKDELDFSSDISIYHIAEQLTNVENHKRIKTYTCSSNSLPYSPLHQQVIINGTQYVVYYNIVFSPRLLSSKPKVVEWNAYVKDENNNICFINSAIKYR